MDFKYKYSNFFDKELNESILVSDFQKIYSVIAHERFEFCKQYFLFSLKNKNILCKNKQKIYDMIESNNRLLGNIIKDTAIYSNETEEFEDYVVRQLPEDKNWEILIQEVACKFIENTPEWDAFFNQIKQKDGAEFIGLLNKQFDNFNHIAYVYLMKKNTNIYDFEFVHLIVEQALLKNCKNNIMWMDKQELILATFSATKDFLEFQVTEESEGTLNKKIKESIDEVLSKKTKWLKKEEDSYYRYTNTEVFYKFKKIKTKLNRMKEYNEKITVSKEDICMIEDTLGVHFNEGQKQAIISSVSNPVILLSGEAGTGKTTVAKGILEMLKRKHLDDLHIYGGAFTGKASKHLGNELSLNSKTSYSSNGNLIIEENGTLDHLIFGNIGQKRRLSKKYKNLDKDNEVEMKDFDKWCEEELYFKYDLDLSDLEDEYVDKEGNIIKQAPFIDYLDLLIIDECSMLSLNKFYDLVMRMRDDSRIILIGDIAQLPPVNDVALLNELRHTGCFKHIHLTEPMRQEGKLYKVIKKIRDSYLPKGFYQKTFILKENDKTIIRGKGESKDVIQDALKDFQNTILAICKVRKVEDIVWDADKRKKVLEYQKNSRTLTLMNRNVDKYNYLILNFLKDVGFFDNSNHKIDMTYGNDDEKEGKAFFEGTRVIFNKNFLAESKSQNEDKSESKRINNGDTGTVVKIVAKEGFEYDFELKTYQVAFVYIQMDYDDSLVCISSTNLKHSNLAYAMTVHKSQGMTIDNITFLYNDYFGSKELIYTAVSRTKKQLTVFCQADKLKNGINNTVYNEERMIYKYL